MAKQILEAKLRLAFDDFLKGVSEAVSKGGDALDEFGKKSDKSQSKLLKFGAAAQVLDTVFKGVGKLISAQKELGDAQDQYAISLRNTGLAGEAYNAELERGAKAQEEIADKFALSTTEVTKLQASIAGISGISGDTLDQLTEFAIGSSKALGMPAESLARALAGAADDEVLGQLKKIGIVFDKNTSQAERFKIMQEKLGPIVEETANRTQSAGGQMDRVLHTVEETIGELAAEVLSKLKPAIDKLLPVIKETGEFLGDLLGYLLDNIDTIGPFVGVILAATKGVSVFNNIVKGLTGSIQKLGASMVAHPYLALVAGLTAVAFAVYKLTDSTISAEKTTRDLQGAVDDARDAYEDYKKIMGEVSGFKKSADATDQLANKYDTLRSKTDRSKKEQIELDKVTKELANQTSKSAVQFDNFGNVMSISTGKVREMTAAQRELADQMAQSAKDDLLAAQRALVTNIVKSRKELQQLEVSATTGEGYADFDLFRSSETIMENAAIEADKMRKATNTSLDALAKMYSEGNWRNVTIDGVKALHKEISDADAAFVVQRKLFYDEQAKLPVKKPEGLSDNVKAEQKTLDEILKAEIKNAVTKEALNKIEISDALKLIESARSRASAIADETKQLEVLNEAQQASNELRTKQSEILAKAIGESEDDLTKGLADIEARRQSRLAAIEQGTLENIEGIVGKETELRTQAETDANNAVLKLRKEHNERIVSEEEERLEKQIETENQLMSQVGFILANDVYKTQTDIAKDNAAARIGLVKQQIEKGILDEEDGAAKIIAINKGLNDSLFEIDSERIEKELQLEKLKIGGSDDSDESKAAAIRKAEREKELKGVQLQLDNGIISFEEAEAAKNEIMKRYSDERIQMLEQEMSVAGALYQTLNAGLSKTFEVGQRELQKLLTKWFNTEQREKQAAAAKDRELRAIRRKSEEDAIEQEVREGIISYEESLNKRLQLKKEADEDEAEAEGEKVNALVEIAQAMSDSLLSIAADAAQKAITNKLAELIADEAEAIGKFIASVAGLPFPLNVALMVGGAAVVGGLFALAYSKGEEAQSSVKGYAKGGKARIGEIAWVGEEGPELMQVTPTGTIITPVGDIPDESIRQGGFINAAGEGEAESIRQAPFINATDQPDFEARFTRSVFGNDTSAYQDVSMRRSIMPEVSRNQQVDLSALREFANVLSMAVEEGITVETRLRGEDIEGSQRAFGKRIERRAYTKSKS